uniref:Uncharacterized protein n=1 Tax=Noctiluca scintillans TaxID=2966 RepID=A0A7S1AKD0_NOCSC|mmetsp:Transcript_49936/g.132751  ORF Transcript_49936/g.132751 Transcript_49936/m.132751 type:complete len:218 (+) Transcript_49936:63-716(+)
MAVFFSGSVGLDGALLGGEGLPMSIQNKVPLWNMLMCLMVVLGGFSALLCDIVGVVTWLVLLLLTYFAVRRQFFSFMRLSNILGSLLCFNVAYYCVLLVVNVHRRLLNHHHPADRPYIEVVLKAPFFSHKEGWQFNLANFVRISSPMVSMLGLALVLFNEHHFMQYSEELNANLRGYAAASRSLASAGRLLERGYGATGLRAGAAESFTTPAYKLDT